MGVGARVGRWLGANRFLQSRYFKPVVFLACLAPGAELIYQTFWGDLGVNPIETLLHTTGRTALAILLVTLSVTPLRRLLAWNRVQFLRRMLGLWAFSYALVHFSLYVLFDQACIVLADCQVAAIWDDVTKRKFIFAGMLSFVLLLLLALTSTKGWIRRLGRNWTRLHRVVYVAAASGVVHFIWKQKSDYTEPSRWAAVLALLLALRVWFAVKRRIAARPPATAAR